MGLFRKKTKHNKRAVVFVDYEHWYISFDRFYNKKPDVKAFRDELAQTYDIVDISFFADFSNPSLRQEISRIRAVTGSIIETQNASNHYKKDFTDFIMLDHIYQQALMMDTADTFIIFSGDGHFSSVVSFLKTKCRKEVGIYGVKDAISNALRVGADWTVEVSGEDTVYLERVGMILDSIRAVQEKNPRARITFWATVEAVSQRNFVDKEVIAEALRGLIEDGYILQYLSNDGRGAMRLMEVDWVKCKKDGLYRD